MTKESIIQQIDKSIQQAKMLVEVGKALSRLSSNRDFKTVITTGYFEREAIRLVHLKADVNMQSSEAQCMILKQMDSIGALHAYLDGATFLAELAEKNIKLDEEERDELLAEGAI